MNKKNQSKEKALVKKINTFMEKVARENKYPICILYASLLPEHSINACTKGAVHIKESGLDKEIGYAYSFEDFLHLYIPLCIKYAENFAVKKFKRTLKEMFED